MIGINKSKVVAATLGTFAGGVGVINVLNGIATYVTTLDTASKERKEHPDNQNTNKDKVKDILKVSKGVGNAILEIGVGTGCLELGRMLWIAYVLLPSNTKPVPVNTVEFTTTVENN